VLSLRLRRWLCQKEVEEKGRGQEQKYWRLRIWIREGEVGEGYGKIQQLGCASLLSGRKGEGQGRSKIWGSGVDAENIQENKGGGRNLLFKFTLYCARRSLCSEGEGVHGSRGAFESHQEIVFGEKTTHASHGDLGDSCFRHQSKWDWKEGGAAEIKKGGEKLTAGKSLGMTSS